MTEMIDLPLEVREAILCCLPDLDSLGAAVRAHSALYYVYALRREYIVSCIVRNFIPPDLLPDAVLALHSASLLDSREGSAFRDTVGVLLDTHSRALQTQASYSCSQAQSRGWSLPEAIAMYRLHAYISFLTEDYLSAALLVQPDLPQDHPSPAERSRAARSFYRFEIHQNLFRRRYPWRAGDEVATGTGTGTGTGREWEYTAAEQWDLHYRKFAVWELEQLACVTDYLFRKIAVPFNQVAAHDVEWAAHGIGYGFQEAWQTYRAGSTRIGHILEQGIEFLYKVITTDDYDSLRTLLFPPARQGSAFLPQIFPGLFAHNIPDTPPFRDYTPQQRCSLKQAEKAESDGGPWRAWRWAHADLPRMDFVSGVPTRELRRWAYVMWDDTRLDRCVLLRKGFVRPPSLNRVEVHRLKSKVVESMACRYRLYLRGASGWWAEGEESRLVWGGSKEEDEDEVVRKVALFQYRSLMWPF